jgi:hypothetical protein
LRSVVFVSGISPQDRNHGMSYQVLTQLYEDAAVLLQDLERTFGAALVTCVQNVVLLFLVLDFFSFVQCCSITISFTVRPCMSDSLCQAHGSILIDAQGQHCGDPRRALSRIVPVLDVV